MTVCASRGELKRKGQSAKKVHSEKLLARSYTSMIQANTGKP